LEQPSTISLSGALIYIYIDIIQGTNEAGKRKRNRDRKRGGGEGDTDRKRGKETEKERTRFTISEGCARSVRLGRRSR